MNMKIFNSINSPHSRLRPTYYDLSDILGVVSKILVKCKDMTRKSTMNTSFLSKRPFIKESILLKENIWRTTLKPCTMITVCFFHYAFFIWLHILYKSFQVVVTVVNNLCPSVAWKDLSTFLSLQDCQLSSDLKVTRDIAFYKTRDKI